MKNETQTALRVDFAIKNNSLFKKRRAADFSVERAEESKALDLEIEDVPVEKRTIEFYRKKLLDCRVLKRKEIQRYGQIENEKETIDEELKRIKVPLSVRERIEYFENILSPAYKQTKQFTTTAEAIGFHESRWLYILRERADDPIVKKFLQFIDDNKKRGMTIEVFARRLAGFFDFTSNKIHVPPLEDYTASELKSELITFFGETFDDFTLDIVCALRRDLNPTSSTVASVPEKVV